MLCCLNRPDFGSPVGVSVVLFSQKQCRFLTCCHIASRYCFSQPGIQPFVFRSAAKVDRTRADRANQKKNLGLF